MTTRLAGSGRVTTDITEAARIVFCWHFCWHSRVEDFQTTVTPVVGFGGEGRNRTMSSPTTSLNILIYNGILTLILQGFKRFLTLSANDRN
jgi:hypothetical protein